MAENCAISRSNWRYHHAASLSTAQLEKIDTEVESEIKWLQKPFEGVRRIRAEMDIPPGKLLPVLLQNGSDIDQQRVNNNHTYLMKLANSTA